MRISYLTSAVITLVIVAQSAIAQTAILDETFAYDSAAPAAGQWVGEFTADGEEPVFGQLIIERGAPANADATWEARLTAFPFGAMQSECGDLAIDGRSLAFAHSIMGRTFRFVASIDEAAQIMTGEVLEATDPSQPPEMIGQFRFGRRPRISECSAPIYFTGNLDMGPIALPMSIALATTEGGNWLGHLDVPAQTVRELPILEMSQGEDGFITGSLPVPGGATLRLKIDDATSRLVGTFSQAGMETKIDFPIDLNYEYKELVRPQEPRPPFPYAAREITIEHPAGFTLAGTLTIPNADDFGPGPYPAAILISGSGQQDRDESLLGHKPFLVIADYLTRRGVAVLRYDDRGVGASRVPSERMAELVMNATSADFATDAAAMFDALAQQPEIDGSRIGLIGHSEGGLIAPLVAKDKPEVAYMILLAGPGVRGGELLSKQIGLIFMASGMAENAVEPLVEGISNLQRLVVEQASDAAVAEAMNALTPLFVEAGLVSAEEAAASNNETDAGLAMFNTPWMRYFFSCDPAEALRAAKCPILALNGEKDLQVWHEQNLDAIEHIVSEAGGDITAIRYEGLNHLFQPCTTGHPSEYASIETTFDEQVLADIVKWMAEKGMK
jgi:pimeloyl-ACP methyl ester carboxylesterase